MKEMIEKHNHCRRDICNGLSAWCPVCARSLWIRYQ